jgi:hypothetical protein
MTDPNGPLTRNLERRRVAFGRTRTELRDFVGITRPPKIGGTTAYVSEVALGHDLIRDNEVDGDLDVIYQAHNDLADAFNAYVAAMPPGPALPPFAGADVNKILFVETATQLAWTDKLNNFELDGALILGPFGVSIAADNGILSDRRGIMFTDAGGGFLWLSGQELMSLTGTTTAAASLHLRPTGTDGFLGKEALEINGALIVRAASAPTPLAGTLQYVSGHFQGYTGAAWVQLDNVAATPSPFQEDASSIYPVTLTKPLGLGVNAPVNDSRLYAKSSNQVTNGETSLRIENTNPGTNQLVGTRMVTPTVDWLVAVNQQLGSKCLGFYQTSAGSPQGMMLLNYQGGNTLLDNVTLVPAEFFGQSGIGAGFNSFLMHGKGDVGQVTGGASSTALFDLRSMNWVWPAGGTGVSRRYRHFVLGSIARSAGQVTLQVVFGNASSPTTIYTWQSGAVSWAAANFWLEVDLFLYLGTCYYCVRCWLTTDPASQSAAASCSTFMSRGSVAALQSSSSPLLKVQGQFDTSNAANQMSAWANYLQVGLLR